MRCPPVLTDTSYFYSLILPCRNMKSDIHSRFAQLKQGNA